MKKESQWDEASPIYAGMRSKSEFLAQVNFNLRDPQTEMRLRYLDPRPGAFHRGVHEQLPKLWLFREVNRATLPITTPA
jgi:hypothetical protein